MEPLRQDIPDQILGAIEVSLELPADAQFGEHATELRTTNFVGDSASETALADHRSAELPDMARPVTESAPTDMTAPTSETPFSMNADLMQMCGMLRQEFRTTVAELQAAQTAAATSQSEILRTLTEVMLQSLASRDISPESLERAFSGVEDRLIARIESITSDLRSAESSSSGTATSRTSGLPDSTGTAKLQNAASTVNRSWAQIRSEMISRHDNGDTATTSEDAAAEQLPKATQLSSDRHFRLPEQDPHLEVPGTIDPDTVSHDELRAAFREREVFISNLIARFRRQQEMATGQLSLEQLRTLVTELPEELATQVRHTLKQMDDLFRMGELELSLERARIARQVNQLEHSRQLIERNARQLGLNMNPDGTLLVPANQPCRNSSSRRWLGKLGFGQ